MPVVHKIDRNNNMGLVRYILALGVMISHFNLLCGGDIVWIVDSYDAVSGFFTLSGFLLIYPILRGKSLRQYLVDRAWRLLPSYLFVVTVFAVGLSTVSSLPPAEYFASAEFWKYLGVNLLSLNFLQPVLPGVFEGLPIEAVNGSLWTIKIEWQLSLTMPFIILFIKYCRFNFRRAVIAILIVSLIYRTYLWYMFDITGKEIYEILARQLIGQLVFFYSGIFIYTYYERLRRNLLKTIIIASAILIALRLIPYMHACQEYIYPFALSVAVIAFSLIPKDLGKMIDGGNNISYEIYLCHFPVMQLLAWWRTEEKIGMWATFACALALTVAAAVITYLCVGNLYMKRKSRALGAVTTK